MGFVIGTRTYLLLIHFNNESNMRGPIITVRYETEWLQIINIDLKLQVTNCKFISSFDINSGDNAVRQEALTWANVVKVFST